MLIPDGVKIDNFEVVGAISDASLLLLESASRKIDELDRRLLKLETGVEIGPRIKAGG